MGQLGSIGGSVSQIELIILLSNFNDDFLFIYLKKHIHVEF